MKNNKFQRNLNRILHVVRTPDKGGERWRRGISPPGESASRFDFDSFECLSYCRECSSEEHNKGSKEILKRKGGGGRRSKRREGSKKQIHGNRRRVERPLFSLCFGRPVGQTTNKRPPPPSRRTLGGRNRGRGGFSWEGGGPHGHAEREAYPIVRKNTHTDKKWKSLRETTTESSITNTSRSREGSLGGGVSLPLVSPHHGDFVGFSWEGRDPHGNVERKAYPIVRKNTHTDKK